MRTPLASWGAAPAAEVFAVFFRLGLTSFGGPAAHLGYFRDTFVTRRRWLGDRAYADLVALCQFLPGPVSSQVGIGIGLVRAGYAGALAAWLGFTLPSAAAMIGAGLLMVRAGEFVPGGILHGLKLAAVAVVAQAVWGMGKSLCPDRARATLMGVSCAVALTSPGVTGQLGALAAAGAVGAFLFRPEGALPHEPLGIGVSRRSGAAALLLFVLFALSLPLAAFLTGDRTVAMTDAFFRAGSLVFGGGHVVLPLLQGELVAPGWVTPERFVAGYGAAQALPGPLFTFAAYLGAVMNAPPAGIAGGVAAVTAIFAPSFLLVTGALPFWETLRGARRTRGALTGINGAVVGILLAALYDPVFLAAVHRPADLALALGAYLALTFWRFPPWGVVALCGAGGMAIG